MFGLFLAFVSGVEGELKGTQKFLNRPQSTSQRGPLLFSTYFCKACSSHQYLLDSKKISINTDTACCLGHSVVTMNVRQTQAFLCDTEGSYTVAMYRLKPGECLI